MQREEIYMLRLAVACFTSMHAPCSRVKVTSCSLDLRGGLLVQGM